MQVSIYGFSYKKHTQHIAVKSIRSYHSAPFSNFLGTFWEHSFPLSHLRIKASWMDYLNRKSLYTYLCDRMSIHFSRSFSTIIPRPNRDMSYLYSQFLSVSDIPAFIFLLSFHLPFDIGNQNRVYWLLPKTYFSILYFI